MTPTMESSLRALRDCGVVRATGHPGFMGLAASGYATGQRRYRDGAWVVDYCLTDAGRAVAVALSSGHRIIR